MAAGYHDFASGEVLTAANLEDYCQNQSVMRFASTAARDTALSAILTEGLCAYTTTDHRLWVYSGSAWQLVSWTGATGRPGVVLTDAAQSIASGAAADITWGTEVSDNDGWTSGGSATLTVPTGWAGQYILSYFGSWAANPGTQSGVALFLNGTAVAAYETSVGSTFSTPHVTIVRTLAAADTIKVQAFQNSGGAVNLVSRLEIAWCER